MGRVLFVTNVLHSQAGGAERVAVNLSNALVDAGHEVCIVSLQSHTGPIFFDLKSNVSIFYIGDPSNSFAKLFEKVISRYKILKFFHKFAWKVQFSKTTKSLARVVNHWLPDNVIAFSGSSLSISRASLKSGSGYRFIASIHNTIEAEFFDENRWSSNTYDISLRQAAIKEADLVTVLTDEFAAHPFLKKNAKEVLVVPNFIEVQDSPPLVSSDDCQQVIAVGRLAKVKRFDMLIRAWSLTKAQKFAKLIILGDGPERLRLNNSIRDLGLSSSVEIKGAVKNPEKEMRKSCLLVHPAEHEGFGLVVLEALANGVPAMAFASCHGVRSIIEDGRSGYLLQGSETPENLALNIDRHIELEYSKRAKIRDAALYRSHKFSKEAVMEIWQSALSKA